MMQIHTFVERIGQGLTGEADVRIVTRMVARMATYELALSEIAEHGGEAAMIATRALAGDVKKGVE